jgi:hypothetical protein
MSRTSEDCEIAQESVLAVTVMVTGQAVALLIQ